MAAQIQLHTEVTVCNIYSSRSHNITQQLLNDLYSQFTHPCLIIGDFNAYNRLWSSADTDNRGKEIEAFVMQHDINIMNIGAPTRILYDTESAIDLFLCSSEIEADLHWNVLSSLGDSDHCSIVISYDETVNFSSAHRWDIKRARWDIYQTSNCWTTLPLQLRGRNDELICCCLAAAVSEAIPNIQQNKFYPKPWWNQEFNQSKERRELFYQQYRRNRTPSNLILWRRNRAQHKKLVMKHKRESWISFVETLQHKSPPATIYEAIRRIKAKLKKINILEENGQTCTTIAEIANRLADTFSDISSNSNYFHQFQQY